MSTGVGSDGLRALTLRFLLELFLLFFGRREQTWAGSKRVWANRVDLLGWEREFGLGSLGIWAGWLRKGIGK